MKTRYALKALGILAERGPAQATLGAEIAEREAIPRKFLEAILRELRQHGFLLAQRGRGGGYRLSKPAEEIPIADVIRALDGSLAPAPCATRTAHRRCAECKSDRACAVRVVLRDLQDATASVLERTTLAELVRRTREAQEDGASPPLRYAV